MVTLIHMSGSVAGTTLITETSETLIASFLLADEQSALGASGRLEGAVLPWCQIVCTGTVLVSAARGLVSGDEISVRGRAVVQKPTRLNDPSDAVLVTVVAECLRILKTTGG